MDGEAVAAGASVEHGKVSAGTFSLYFFSAEPPDFVRLCWQCGGRVRACGFRSGEVAQLIERVGGVGDELAEKDFRV